MPLEKRIVEPVNVSLCPVPAGQKNDLEFVASATFANIIRQLASLSRHACDIFEELSIQATEINQRGKNLSERIKRLRSLEETSSPPAVSQKTFVANLVLDHKVISRAKPPKSLMNAYNNASPPPPLRLLNPYRDDGLDCSKFYTNPEFFFKLWSESVMNFKFHSPGKSSHSNIKSSRAHSTTSNANEERIARRAATTAMITGKNNSLRSLAAKARPPASTLFNKNSSINGSISDKPLVQQRVDRPKLIVYESPSCSDKIQYVSRRENNSENSAKLSCLSRLDGKYIHINNKRLQMNSEEHADTNGNKLCNSVDRRSYKLKVRNELPNITKKTYANNEPVCSGYGCSINDVNENGRNESMKDAACYSTVKVSNNKNETLNRIESDAKVYDTLPSLDYTDMSTRTHSKNGHKLPNVYSNPSLKNKINEELNEITSQFDTLDVGYFQRKNISTLKVEFQCQTKIAMDDLPSMVNGSHIYDKSRFSYDDLPLPPPELFDSVLSPSSDSPGSANHKTLIENQCDSRTANSDNNSEYSAASEYRPFYMRELHSDLLDEIRRGFKLRKVEKSIEAGKERVNDRLDVQSVMEKALRIRRRHTQPESSSDSDDSWGSVYG